MSHGRALRKLTCNFEAESLKLARVGKKSICPGMVRTETPLEKQNVSYESKMIKKHMRNKSVTRRHRTGNQKIGLGELYKLI